tara:strand:- start:333 stop:1253 length:921 start_codon:yes stop_codon:yes gene_type:complete
MAFLDNSGDIIIDAVLTDTGRHRLAKGDGAFAIKKFALGDDEIDYSLYDLDASTGEKDLEIMQTPILEAFTDNAASLKSKLVTIPRNNILYMPVVRANNLVTPAINNDLQMYVVTANDATFDLKKGSSTEDYIMSGETTTAGPSIRIDQGINSSVISPSYNIEDELFESQYIIEIDNRLGKIVSPAGQTQASKNKGGQSLEMSYLDDDNIASYIVTMGSNPNFVTENTTKTEANQVIAGPRGTTLRFAIQASIELNSSSYLFTELGSTDTISGLGSGTLQYIDTTVRIQGATTGVAVDLPVRFVRS